MFYKKLRLNELTDGEMRIFRGMAFQICGAALTESTTTYNNWCV